MGEGERRRREEDGDDSTEGNGRQTDGAFEIIYF
jgi:hypothetical protein